MYIFWYLSTIFVIVCNSWVSVGVFLKSGPTFQDRPFPLSLSTSLWQTALTSRHCLLHSWSLSSMMSCHSLQVREALHRLSASSSPKIFTLISAGRVSAKFWGVVSQVDVRVGLLSQRKNTGEVLVGSCCIIAQCPTVWNGLGKTEWLKISNRKFKEMIT